MDIPQRKAVSPIIATLLLIAIAVSAGVIVYIFTTSLAGNLTQGGGQQMTERLQMQSFNFQVSPGTCACTGQILEIYLVNSGSTTSTISAIYYDGSILANGTTYTNNDVALVNNEYRTFLSTTVLASGGSQDIHLAPSNAKYTYVAGAVGQFIITFTSANTPTSGSSHTIKVVTSTGATFSYSVVAGRSG